MCTIGERIRKLREKRGMSMADLAEKVGYKSRTSVYRVEHGCMDIPLSKVYDFARALQATPEFLIGWVDAPDEETDVVAAENVTRKEESGRPLQKDYIDLAREMQERNIDLEDVWAILRLVEKIRRE